MATDPPAEGQGIEPYYPAIEDLLVYSSSEDVEQLFNRLREGLKALKGPKVEQVKKVQVALERSEELLRHLLEVRQKVADEHKASK